MMTRKDFKAIAEIIRYETGPISNLIPVNYELRKRLAENFAGFLSTQNPEFDREKFLAACGFSS